jgi:uncharacterized protein YjbI with pentapeptide repeats
VAADGDGGDDAVEELPPGSFRVDRGADLSQSDLFAAVADLATRWPEGFNPMAADAYVIGREADLDEADLSLEDLSGADLRGANLADADLHKATLHRTNLAGATLRGASLSKARLEGADLRGADLRGALLITAKLTGAVANSRTRWPWGFDPQTAGVRIVGR